MAARRPSAFDDKRARVAALASADPKAALPELRRFLGDRVAYLAGEAAEVAAKLELRELVPDMALAFRRMLVDPLTSDKGCLGKTRVLEALLSLDADEPEVYLAAIRHVQEEPAWPRKVDTAAPLRGLAAHALVQIDHRDALLEIAPLLADPEPVVRAEAARALGRSGVVAAAAVLHLKALAGDAEPDVIQACFEGMLRLVPSRYLRVVEAALGDESAARAEAAALALGLSRLPEALPPLVRALGAAFEARARQGLLTAIALHRSDEAVAHLIALVKEAPEAQAVAALEALSIHRHDAKVVERARAAVEERGSERLAEALRERFGG